MRRKFLFAAACLLAIASCSSKNKEDDYFNNKIIAISLAAPDGSITYAPGTTCIGNVNDFDITIVVNDKLAKDHDKIIDILSNHNNMAKKLAAKSKNC